MVAVVAVAAVHGHRPGRGRALHGTAKVGSSWYLRVRPRWCCCGSQQGTKTGPTGVGSRSRGAAGRTRARVFRDEGLLNLMHFLFACQVWERIGMVGIFVRFEIMAEIMAVIFEIEIMAGITASGVVEMIGITGTTWAATPAALWSHHTRTLATALPCTCTDRSPAG